MKKNTKAPLSFVQERLYLLDKLKSQPSAYNNANTIRFRGVLDIDHLQHVLTAITRRHDSFRMRFLDDNGVPFVVVMPDVTFNLPVTDLSATGLEIERMEQAFDKARALAMQPFVLSEGALFRFALIRLKRDDHLLVYVAHSIISDRRSVELWLKELITLYDGRAVEQSASDYTAYSSVQQAQITGDALRAKLDYWCQHLEHGDHVLDLPTDQARPALQCFDGATHSVFIDASLSADIRSLAQQCAVDLFVIMKAGFGSLLYRYTGQEDLVIGTFSAGRSNTEFENTVGLFTDTLPVRNHYSGELTFKAVVEQIHSSMAESYRFQDFPFNLLLEKLKPVSDSSRPALVQVAFDFHNAPAPQNSAKGLTITLGEVDTQSSKLDLTLTLTDHGDRLELCFEYNTALFEDRRIQKMGLHLTMLMAAAVKNPYRKLAELTLLTPQEMHQLLVEFNRTERGRSAITSLPVLIEQSVARYPDMPALRYLGTTLTYAQMAQRVSALSDQLIASGVKPGSRVGIFLPRSLELPVAVLAVLKSGAAYVPLEPSDSEQRLCFIVHDAGLGLIISHSKLADRVDRLRSDHAVVYVDESVQGAVHSQHGPAIAPDNIAYLLYSSGATAKAEGVMVSHKNVIAFVQAMTELLKPRPGDVVPLLSTLSFDLSVLELMMPLTSGGTVVIVPEDVAGDGRALGGFFNDAQVRLVQATPATWKLLLAAKWKPATALTALCGGDTLSWGLAERLLALGMTLHHMYGPTETTVWTASHQVTSNSGAVPIGKPIANTKMYVLDAAGNSMPVGYPGELFIGGDGVAAGYYKRAGLTAQRFIPDPFSDEQGARLYRSGNVAQWNEQGCLMFPGSFDRNRLTAAPQPVIDNNTAGEPLRNGVEWKLTGIWKRLRGRST